MNLPTEPIGSLPRTPELLAGLAEIEAGRRTEADIEPLFDAAVADTMARFAATGSPVVTDGEQRKYQNFFTYSLTGAANIAPDGFEIPFKAGHIRRLPRLTFAPFRYRLYASDHLARARRHTTLPVKQAVIAPSALSLVYPEDGIDGYTRDAFISDLLDEHQKDIAGCLAGGAENVQIDFTEGRFALKVDATGALLDGFVDLINLVVRRFPADDRRRLGIHTCAGSDRDSSHSQDVDYADFLPALFEVDVANFYVAMAREADRRPALALIGKLMRPGQRVFVGVVDPTDPRIETPEEVCARILEAAEHIPPNRLGTTDDCGFAPFSDDTTTSRDTAFAKIAARVAGTKLAEKELGARLLKP